MKNIFAIILIIASVGVFFTYIKPTYGTVMDQRAELSSYQDTLVQAQMLDTKISTLQKKVDELDPASKVKLEKLLPDDANNIDLIVDINNIAKNSNLSIKNINIEQAGTGQNDANKGTVPKPDTSGSLYDSIDLTFNVASSYNNFLNFVSDLERSLRIVDITNISFSPVDGSDQYNFKITIRAYWLK